jgi:hypothetical protein
VTVSGDTAGSPGRRLTALIIVNNLLHDLATGIWLGCVVVSAGLAIELRTLEPAAAAAIGEVRHELAWVIGGALAWVIVSGIVRFLFYSAEERLIYPSAGSAYMFTKRYTVAVKHIIIAVLVALTAYVVFWL